MDELAESAIIICIAVPQLPLVLWAFKKKFGDKLKIYHAGTIGGIVAFVNLVVIRLIL